MSVNLGKMTDAINIKLANQIKGGSKGGANSNGLSIGDSKSVMYPGQIIYGETSELPQSVKDYIAKIKDYSFVLENSLSFIMLKQADEAKANMAANSRDESKITAKAADKIAADKPDRSKLSVNVDKAASIQKSESKGFSKYGRELNKGGALTINKSGREVTVSVKAAKGGSNKSVLERLANEINAKDMGIEAKIEGKKTQKLVVKSNETGENQAFSLTGSMAKALGMKTKQKAGDAVYSINGQSRRSSSNKVTEKGVSLNLLKPEAGSAAASVKNGKLEHLDKLVQGFNSLMDVSKEGGSKKLSGQLSSLSGFNRDNLEKAGINTQEDGSLTLDYQKAQTAVNDGSLEKMFSEGGSLSGFGRRLGAIAQKAGKDPGSYIRDMAGTERLKARDIYKAQGMFLNIAL